MLIQIWLTLTWHIHWHIQLRDDTQMTSMKIVQFSRSSTLLSIYVQNSSTPLTLDVKRTPPFPFPNDNQSIQIKKSKDDYHMLSGPSFRSAFVFIVNSLILSSFPLTSFHLFEASLICFSVILCSCVCSCPKISQTCERTVHVNERNQNKNKTKSRYIQIDHAFYCSI